MIRREVSSLETVLSRSGLRRALFVYEMAKTKDRTRPETLRRLGNDVIVAAREVGALAELEVLP